jgi:hypothetical protein
MQGSFVRKRGQNWTACYYVSDAAGQRRQRSKGGFATKKAAQTWLNTTVGSLETGQYVEPAKLTLVQYLEDRWLPTIKNTIRPSTFDSYCRILRLHVIPKLGGVPLQSLTTDHLDRLYQELLATPRLSCGRGTLSPKTVRYIHTTLHMSAVSEIRV